jgi:hypothetical protein
MPIPTASVPVGVGWKGGAGRIDLFAFGVDFDGSGCPFSERGQESGYFCKDEHR